MKTSNKILLGLLAVIFAVPLFLSYSLKMKVRAGEYTVQKSPVYQPEALRNGTFSGFKVIKVIAPSPELLTCQLKFSDTMNFVYRAGNNQDSILVFNESDTLFIKYFEKEVAAGEDNSRYYDLKVTVNLPAYNSLVVDGAVVIVDSTTGPNEVLSVTLKNRGVIKDGSKKTPSQGNKSRELGLRKNSIPSDLAFNKPGVAGNALKIAPIEKAIVSNPYRDVKDRLIFRVL